MQPILYYVHHQGSGHWRRALAVAEHLRSPVVFASSTPPPRPLTAGVYVPLPLDYPAEDTSNHDANGRLHWAPNHHSGLLQRHRLLLDAVAEHRPARAVVDVSVEVAVILRASGVPVTAVRLPGQRDDPAHHLGFGLADDVVMPVPAAWGLHAGLPRTRAVGLVTGDRPLVVKPQGGRARAVIVVGTGGSRLDARRCAEIAAELPDYDVQVLGLASRSRGNLSFAGRVDDAWTSICGASVVIGNTGLGTVGDVVAAGRPFVTLPESRPFDEQFTTARALENTGAAVVLDAMPRSGGWAEAVHRASALGPPPLVADGAERFARLLEAELPVTGLPVTELSETELSETELSETEPATIQLPADELPVAVR